MPADTLTQLKRATLWIVGKVVAISAFLVICMASCGTAYFASQAVFYPAQTEFSNDIPPKAFLVVIEDHSAPQRSDAFSVVFWEKASALMAKDPSVFRLSVKTFTAQGGDPFSFAVLEETANTQLIEMTHQNTSRIETRYRIHGSDIKPLYFKTDGGIGLTMILTPVFIFCLWLGLVAARRAARWVNPRAGGETKVGS